MSATISRPPAVLWHARGRGGGSRPSARASFVSMGDVSMSSRTPNDGGGGGATLPELRVTSPPAQVGPAGRSDLRFDRLQPPEPECNSRHRRVLGRFVAREALLEEEFWTAAWLRAESHWEDQPFVRHAESYKRMFAEKEFTAMKRRCNGQQNAEHCTCIVVVKREEKNVKRSVLNSIVGTLDLSIQFLLQGEKFPGERRRGSGFSSIYKADKPRYAYVANLCVAKHARRQGIASNMLYLAAEAAKSYGIVIGVDQMFVHVNKDNVPAKGLYEKLGFQIVEVSTAQEEQKLMCLKC